MMTFIGFHTSKGKLKLCILAFCGLLFSCKEEYVEEKAEEKGTYVLWEDSAYNRLDLQLLNPAESRSYKAVLYKEYDPGYRDLYTNEYWLRDSSGDDAYRLRILTHILPLDTFVYQTTDQKYNPFDDKVYIEFFRQGAVEKEMLFVSQIHQNDNYFIYKRTDSVNCELKFSFLSRCEQPVRYATIRGKFRIRK